MSADVVWYEMIPESISYRPLNVPRIEVLKFQSAQAPGSAADGENRAWCCTYNLIRKSFSEVRGGSTRRCDPQNDQVRVILHGNSNNFLLDCSEMYTDHGFEAGSTLCWK